MKLAPITAILNGKSLAMAAEPLHNPNYAVMIVKQVTSHTSHMKQVNPSIPSCLPQG